MTGCIVVRGAIRASANAKRMRGLFRPRDESSATITEVPRAFSSMSTASIQPINFDSRNRSIEEEHGSPDDPAALVSPRPCRGKRLEGEWRFRSDK